MFCWPALHWWESLMRIRAFVRKWNRGHAGIQKKFVVVFSVVIVKTQLKLWQQNCNCLPHDSSHRLLHRLFWCEALKQKMVPDLKETRKPSWISLQSLYAVFDLIVEAFLFKIDRVLSLIGKFWSVCVCSELSAPELWRTMAVVVSRCI